MTTFQIRTDVVIEVADRDLSVSDSAASGRFPNRVSATPPPELRPLFSRLGSVWLESSSTSPSEQEMRTAARGVLTDELLAQNFDLAPGGINHIFKITGWKPWDGGSSTASYLFPIGNRTSGTFRPMEQSLTGDPNDPFSSAVLRAYIYVEVVGT